MNKNLDIIILEDIFGNPFSITGYIIGYKTKGFNLKSGGWSLYKINDECKSAKFMLFKIQRRRNISIFNMNRILEINGKKNND